MSGLPQPTIDRMVLEASEVERGSNNECVQNICCHVKALACEIERLEVYRKLFTHALDCVDSVFQVDSHKPAPLLPDFLHCGDCKFEGVEKLANAFKKQADEIARYRAALEMITQILSGNCRFQGKLARAALDGADLRNLEEVEAVR